MYRQKAKGWDGVRLTVKVDVVANELALPYRPLRALLTASSALHSTHLFVCLRHGLWNSLCR